SSCTPPEAAWVPLGVLACRVDESSAAPPKKLTFEDRGRYYRQVFSNEALSRLVFGLAERAGEAGRGRVLGHEGGDGQPADVYHQVKDPLVVKVIDSTGEVLKKDPDSVRVRFDLLGEKEGAELIPVHPANPDGSAADLAALWLQPDGMVSVKWKLGKE